MGNVAVYTRISRDATGDGAAVQRQESACRTMAASMGLTDIAVYSDNDVSAYVRRRRPAYERMLADIRDGIVTMVLCWHTDRLHRRLDELEEYIDACQAGTTAVPTYTVHGGHLDLSTAEGRFTARMHGVLARRESELRSARVREAKSCSRRSGRYDQGPRVPFGWTLDDDGHPVLDELAAGLIREGFRAIQDGRGTAYVAATLNESGLASRYGNQWTYSTVRQLLMRPHCAGIELEPWRGPNDEKPLLSLRAKVAASEMPPIVSENEWRQVVGILESAERRTQRSTRIRHLLSNILSCHCGSPMRAKRKGDVWSYACVETARATGMGNRRTVDRHCTRRTSPVDQYVLGRLAEELAVGSAGIQVEMRHVDASEIEAVRAKIVRLEEQQTRLFHLVTDAENALPVEQFAWLNTELNTKIRQLEQRAVLREDKCAGGIVLTGQDVNHYLEVSDLDSLRTLIRLAITVTCRPSSNNRTPVDEVVTVLPRSTSPVEGGGRGPRGVVRTTLPSLENEVGRVCPVRHRQA